MRKPSGAVVALGILLGIFAVAAFAASLPQWAGWLTLLVLGAGVLLVLLHAEPEERKRRNDYCTSEDPR